MQRTWRRLGIVGADCDVEDLGLEDGEDGERGRAERREQGHEGEGGRLTREAVLGESSVL